MRMLGVGNLSIYPRHRTRDRGLPVHSRLIDTLRSVGAVAVSAGAAAFAGSRRHQFQNPVQYQ